MPLRRFIEPILRDYVDGNGLALSNEEYERLINRITSEAEIVTFDIIRRRMNLVENNEPTVYKVYRENLLRVSSRERRILRNQTTAQHSRLSSIIGKLHDFSSLLRTRSKGAIHGWHTSKNSPK